MGVFPKVLNHFFQSSFTTQLNLIRYGSQIFQFLEFSIADFSRSIISPLSICAVFLLPSPRGDGGVSERSACDLS